MAARPIRTKDGKQIGLLKGNDLFKTARKSDHLFRKIGANGSWGLDYEVLFNELPPRCTVYIRETEEGVLYTADASKWKDYGEVLHFKNGEDDHYTQVFLPIEYFKKQKLKD
jgi:hypothetical protein